MTTNTLAPPDDLTEYAKAVWSHAVKTSRRELKQSDAATLRVYCEASDRASRTAQELTNLIGSTDEARVKAILTADLDAVALQSLAGRALGFRLGR